MSELLDKQVNVQKESLKKIRQTSECTKREFEKTSGVHASSRKPTKKCAMKMKERKKERKKVEEKKQLPRQKNFCGRKDL